MTNTSKSDAAPPNERRLSGPTKLILAWIAFVLVGAVLLRLPASAQETPLTWIDALFTSTSAVCVTGLSTIDIGERLSPMGQGILLSLIQIGGLGISTVVTLLFVAAGQTAMSHHYEVQESLASVRTRPFQLLVWAVVFTFVAEGLGAAVLAQRLEGPNRVWSALFHSVSAFCNAGFSLYSDSLVRFRSDALVNGVVAILIACGGLGFIALRQLSLWIVAVFSRKRSPLFLHTRVVLLASLSLWTLGAAAFSALEWTQSLETLSPRDKLLAGAFQSVTARTAGFNTVDISAMREPTLLLVMLLMFVGGAPGSCAGGIKVTTAVVVLALMRARIRGDDNVFLLQRTIPPPLVVRALYMTMLCMVFVCVIIVLLVISEEQMPGAGGRTDRLTVLSFEAVSAFGTVGLSAGITPQLSPAGKWLIMIAMFVGRLGPATVALAVWREQRRARFEYPKEELAVG